VAFSKSTHCDWHIHTLYYGYMERPNWNQKLWLLNITIPRILQILIFSLTLLFTSQEKQNKTFNSIKYVNKNVCKDCCLLACDAMLSGRSVLTFQNPLPLLSSEISGHVYQTTWQHIPQDSNLHSPCFEILRSHKNVSCKITLMLSCLIF
jgi:hypothetical protein